MHDWNVAEKAADIAKEIVVSKIDSCSIIAQSGRKYNGFDKNRQDIITF